MLSQKHRDGPENRRDRIYGEITSRSEETTVGSICNLLERQDLLICRQAIVSAFCASAQELASEIDATGRHDSLAENMISRTLKRLQPELRTQIRDRFEIRTRRELESVHHGAIPSARFTAAFDAALNLLIADVISGRMIHDIGAQLQELTEVEVASRAAMEYGSGAMQAVGSIQGIYPMFELMCQAPAILAPFELEVFYKEALCGKPHAQVAAETGQSTETVAQTYMEAVEKVKQLPAYARLCP